MKLSRSSPTPLYLQIEALIRSDIEDGTLAPNDQVSSEPTWAAELGVSRMTVRKALDNLVSEGLLFRQPGKGTFVAPSRIPHGLSTQQSFSAAMDLMGIQHSTQVLFAGLHRAGHVAATALGIADGDPIVSIRRVRLIEGAPMAIHHSDLPAVYTAILDADLSGSLTGAMRSIGAIIVSARDTVEAVTATTEVATLLQVPDRTPLIRVEGVAFASSKLPIRYTEALYRCDRFRLAIDSSAPELQIEVVGPQRTNSDDDAVRRVS